MVYIGFLFLADPLGMLCYSAEMWGHALHLLCNASWEIFKAFLTGLDVTETVLYKDAVVCFNNTLRYLSEQLAEEFSYTNILLYIYIKLLYCSKTIK